MATRLYLRDTPSRESPQGGTKSAVLPNAAAGHWTLSVQPQVYDRSLLTVRGQTLPESIVQLTTQAHTDHDDDFMARFTTRKLTAQTIAANTWTAAMAFLETNASANSQMMLSVYVWDPVGRSVVGYIWDSHTTIGVEWAATLDGIVATFAGSAVTCRDGDVIVCEVWRHTPAQGVATAFLQQLHFNGYVDVLDATTADPASYIETPQTLTFAPNELPQSIPGVFVETPGYAGPLMTANGDIYVVAEIGELGPDPCMYRSQDGGKTWTEPGSGSRPTGSTWADLESWWMLLSGTTIKAMRQRSGSSANNIAYFEYNTSGAGATPDTWTLSESVVGVTGGSTNMQQNVLIERSNGDLLAFYVNWVSAASQIVAYKKKPSGGAWSAQVTVHAGAAGVVAVLGASDTIHLFLKQDSTTAIGGGTNSLLYRTLNSSDTLSAASAVEDTANVSASEGCIAQAVLYNDGTERIYVTWQTTTGEIHGAFVVGGTPQPEEIVTLHRVEEDPLDTRQQAAVASLTLDAETNDLYLVYGHMNNWVRTPTTANLPPLGQPTAFGDGHMYVTKRKYGGTGWDAPQLMLGDIRLQIIMAKVFRHSAANGGRKVLGVFYDDANGPFYHELQLEVTPPAALKQKSARARR